MERESLLALLSVASLVVLAWSAAAAAAVAAGLGRRRAPRGARRPTRLGGAARAERRAWIWVFVPLAPGAAMGTVLVGWAMGAPDPAPEQPTWVLAVLASGAGLVAVRATWRAWRSWRAAQRPSLAPISTGGLLVPRVRVSPAFRRAATPAALDAALAHERAHALSRDPLRLWVAQIATDLQWPIPGAARRLTRWERALELRRDQEALADGADPAALAEAILTAARLVVGRREDDGWGGDVERHAAVGLGAGEALRERVDALLGGAPASVGGPTGQDPPAASRAGLGAGLVVLVATASTLVVLGYTAGDALLRALPWLVQ